MARRAAHHLVLAFPDDPDAPRLTCANAACVLALKQAAFGRTRPLDDTPVERGFHDAYLLISQVPDAVLADLALAEYEVKRRSTDAISLLATGAEETAAAARQIVRLDNTHSQRAAETEVRRAAVRIQRRMSRMSHPFVR
jgi:hypothetical protein